MESGRGVGDKVPKDNLGIKRKMTNCTFGYNGIVHEILRHSFLVSISQYELIFIHANIPCKFYISLAVLF